MRLTWRDGVATLLAIGVIVVATAVVSEWGWPLLGSYRAGAAAVFVLGMGMCALGNRETPSVKDGYSRSMMLLGAVALGLGIWALIADTQGPFVAFAMTTVVMWAVSTTMHLVPQGKHVAAHGV
jgi:uncharacterized membrane protein